MRQTDCATQGILGNPTPGSGGHLARDQNHCKESILAACLESFNHTIRKEGTFSEHIIYSLKMLVMNWLPHLSPRCDAGVFNFLIWEGLLVATKNNFL